MASRGPVPFCTSCGGVHDPDPPGKISIVFKSRRFRSPFHCLCCGKEICARQFAFGRCCGYCDTGKCQLGLVHVDPAYQDSFLLAGASIIYETGHGCKDVFENGELMTDA